MQAYAGIMPVFTVQSVRLVRILSVLGFHGHLVFIQQDEELAGIRLESTS